MKKNPLSPFDVELFRNSLAEEEYLDTLVLTYDKNNPEIPDFNSKTMWDKLNSQNTDLATHPMANDRAHQVARTIFSNTKVLNIGFGSCNLERVLKNSGKKINLHGIDISPVSVKLAKSTFPEWHFKIGNIKKIPYRNNTFDFSVCLEVLEHIPPRFTFKAWRELVRVTKPGGVIIVSVPLNEGLREMISKGKNPNAHVRTYTPSLLKAEAKILGLIIRKEFHLFAYNGHYKLKSWLAKNFKLLRKQPNNIILMMNKP